MRCLKFGNFWGVVQLIRRPTTTEQKTLTISNLRHLISSDHCHYCRLCLPPQTVQTNARGGHHRVAADFGLVLLAHAAASAAAAPLQLAGRGVRQPGRRVRHLATHQGEQGRIV